MRFYIPGKQKNNDIQKYEQTIEHTENGNLKIIQNTIKILIISIKNIY